MSTIRSKVCVLKGEAKTKRLEYLMADDEILLLGFGGSLYFSKDGRALSQGWDEADVLRHVESLLSERRHSNIAFLERWSEQKRKQDEETARVLAERGEREQAAASAEKTLKLFEHITKRQLNMTESESIREAILKAKGISPKEED